MKKSLIVASASAVALAAMPIVGVFAADDANNVTDTISVTIESVCQYDDTTSSGHTYAISNQIPGTLVTPTSGTPTELTIHCTNVKGYQITPTFSVLKRSADTAETATNIAYGDGVTGNPAIAAADSQTWTAYYSLNSGTAAVFPIAGVTGNTSYTDTYELSYKVGLENDQPAGTYTGTALYTIAAQN